MKPLCNVKTHMWCIGLSLMLCKAQAPVSKHWSLQKSSARGSPPTPSSASLNGPMLWSLSSLWQIRILKQIQTVSPLTVELDNGHRKLANALRFQLTHSRTSGTQWINSRHAFHLLLQSKTVWEQWYVRGIMWSYRVRVSIFSVCLCFFNIFGSLPAFIDKCASFLSKIPHFAWSARSF